MTGSVGKAQKARKVDGLIAILARLSVLNQATNARNARLVGVLEAKRGRSTRLAGRRREHAENAVVMERNLKQEKRDNMSFTKKPKSKINIANKKGASMPWLPANITNLPKNVPPFSNSKYLLDLWYDMDDKVDKMNEALKLKKLEIKQRKGKSIIYKKISDWEYEVVATDRKLGFIEQKNNSKWTIKPTFDYEDTFFSQISLKTEHYDFRKAGNALIQFWIDN